MTTTFIHRPAVLALAITMLAGCAVKPAEPGKLAAPPERISDQIIHRDHAMFAGMQARHRKLNAEGQPIASYSMAKAQCWMDVAFHEYHRNDRTAFPQGALDEAGRLLSALEKKATPPADTPLVDGATKLREDLWTKAESLKKHRGFGCVANRVACAEVELVHAGHEYNQGGWRYANPYVRIAEDRLQSAERDAQTCPEAAPAPTAPRVETPRAPAPPVPVPARLDPPPAPKPAPPVSMKMTLGADALFDFARSDATSMKSDGKARIATFATELKQAYARIDSIKVIGHTDRLGGADYNRQLSVARANTVANLLVAQGVDIGLFTVAGKGPDDPVAQCDGVAPKNALVACLAPNRRVEIAVEGVRR